MFKSYKSSATLHTLLFFLGASQLPVNNKANEH